ncbi:ATP phosphoribosyltransferase regulatory subunit [Pinisolibacter aquiterrae]|uniref:ATP phosphoribosyltransferase regulatory subunit n=1 Tax=Pinisolibacter aquiterrae TaxID=2815579 RepID=UPI001E295E30|nr:ATP phosphoribosyltransferase regulatory subunit [Pinisolibacter aquiterrae]MCC8234983.1 ATP phosphoribosyltransferase regulatory subunit [Pinisolibacter aquiterrae]
MATRPPSGFTPSGRPYQPGGKFPHAEKMAAMLAEAGIETPEQLGEALAVLDGGDELSAFDPTAELVALFQREAEAEMVEPPILLPADLFLDTAGEDIRRRLFLTMDADGREMCLRPDFTIPICRHYLETGAPGREAALGYFGPVFRQRVDEPSEFLQAGIEIFGNDDRAAADADVLALAYQSATLFAVDEPIVKIGDEGLFLALLDGLGLAAPLRRRLRGLFGTPDRLGATIRRLAAGEAGSEAIRHAGILGALAGSKPEEAQSLVEDLLGLAGIASVGGRSAHEIAERFLEQAAIASQGGLAPEAARILTRYLALSTSPERAVDALDAFQAEVGVDMTRAIDLFARRNDAFRDCGIELDRQIFHADFGRNLDYYTGFVFEMRDPDHADGKPVIGGGRYDGLLERLGSPAPVAACGFSMWLDRLGIAGYGQELGEGA